MDEERQNELEYNQKQEYSQRIRNAKKKKEAEEKNKKGVKNKIEEKVGKVAGMAIKKWIYVLMLSVVGFIPAVIALDIYAIISLLSKKIGKMKIWDWGILIFVNFILAIILIVAFMIIYCAANPIECGWEAVKKAAKAVVK